MKYSHTPKDSIRSLRKIQEQTKHNKWLHTVDTEIPVCRGPQEIPKMQWALCH